MRGEQLFQPGPAGDLYARIRDGADPGNRSARSRLEALWTEYRTYASPAFSALARNDLLAAFWEMYVGCTFLRSGKTLAPSSGKGPDLRIGGAPPFWVEATAPDLGEPPNKIPEQRPTRLAESSEREIMLRYTGAVAEKVGQRDDWLHTSLVAASDPYVVAVGVGRFREQIFESSLPSIVRCTLGMGPLEAEQLPDGQEVFSFEAPLKKASGQTIETALFFRPEFRGISAVVWSAVDPYRLPVELGSEVIWVFNPNATSPITPSDVAFGMAYWMEGQVLQAKNHERR